MNPILNSDSYKTGHYAMYDPSVEGEYAYIAPRSSEKYSEVLFFGLQMALKEYLMKGVTKSDIQEAQDIFQLHGVPFNLSGWQKIQQLGYWPVSIKAVPEGLVLPTKLPLVTIESTDSNLSWVVSYLETMLLRSVWYPSTVATRSMFLRRELKHYLQLTCDDPEAMIDFRLHDFGARGASSLESAGLGGAAHLVNFNGTDTIPGLLFARKYYGEPCAGVNIPAAQHSTVMSWGLKREKDAFLHMVDNFGGEGRMYSVITDTYDYEHAVENIWCAPDTVEAVKARGGTLVIRPDSGDPSKLLPWTLRKLAQAYGSSLNKKNYSVLNPSVRVIWGDGVSEETLPKILDAVVGTGFSTENIVLGMGGALLQKLDRDTMGWAQKTSAVRKLDQWIGVSKSVATDSSKKSYSGRVVTRLENYFYVLGTDASSCNVMREVFCNGELIVDDSFAAIRKLARA